ncbi:MAG: SUMF1/EgtB/PvdO family nonheme iron enzyme, partial [Bacteroidales bacterium]|nr:SUMF1/EgtB/PvdO family nonheme iron enzyme [Bacteroidales bacterium]
YDMSGNEAEWTSSTPTTNSGDRYYSGTSSSTYLNRHYVMGGKYNDNEDYLRPSNTTVSEYYSHTSIEHKYGLRLALRFD